MIRRASSGANRRTLLIFLDYLSAFAGVACSFLKSVNIVLIFSEGLLCTMTIWGIKIIFSIAGCLIAYRSSCGGLSYPGAAKS
jgi:hypothetical protein